LVQVISIPTNLGAKAAYVNAAVDALSKACPVTIKPYFFTLQSTNPQYDVMELKSIEDWVVEKNLKSATDIVEVASFGGPTREYQVRLDPNKLIAYGLSIGQVEQQLTNNNINAGGSFIEAGLQHINVMACHLLGRRKSNGPPPLPPTQDCRHWVDRSLPRYN